MICPSGGMVFVATAAAAVANKASASGIDMMAATSADSVPVKETPSLLSMGPPHCTCCVAAVGRMTVPDTVNP